MLFSRRHAISSYHDYHRAYIDAAIIAVSMVVVYWLIADLDLFEALYGYSRAHEEAQLDEVVIVVLLATLGLILFGVRRIVDQRREIAARQKAEDRASYLALADGLTGLPNRRQLEARLGEALKALAEQQTPMALMMIDLDRFKQINDVFGHGKGDEILVAFSRRASRFTEGGVLARFGGDEFALLLPSFTDPEMPTRVARRIIGLFDRPFAVGDLEMSLGASIGIAVAPADGVTADELLRRADIALYRAKREGRGTFRFFEPEMDMQVKRRDRLERDLRKAIEDGAIEATYQPVVSLRDSRVSGFEAVPRWSHPEFGDIPAEMFVGIAEDSGMITDLFNRLLHQACRDAAGWPSDMILSINVPVLQISDPMLPLRVVRTVGQTGLSPARLQLEVSEAALVGSTDAVKRALSDLRDAGIRIALSAFGAGKSSLYHLRECAFDRVKIDASFVRSMRNSASDAAFVRAVVGLSKALGLPVSAEGVDDPALTKLLLADGCDEGQGAGFGAPVSASEAQALVDRRGAVREVG